MVSPPCAPSYPARTSNRVHAKRSFAKLSIHLGLVHGFQGQSDLVFAGNGGVFRQRIQVCAFCPVSNSHAVGLSESVDGENDQLVIALYRLNRNLPLGVKEARRLRRRLSSSPQPIWITHFEVKRREFPKVHFR
jgi:hypothetical protein